MSVNFYVLPHIDRNLHDTKRELSQALFLRAAPQAKAPQAKRAQPDVLVRALVNYWGSPTLPQTPSQLLRTDIFLEKNILERYRSNLSSPKGEI